MSDINLYEETDFQLRCYRCRVLIPGYLKYQYGPIGVESSEPLDCITVSKIDYKGTMIFEVLCENCFKKLKEESNE